MKSTVFLAVYPGGKRIKTEDATARNTACREDTDDANDPVTAVTDGVLHFIICNTENVTVVTDVTVKCNGANARKY